MKPPRERVVDLSPIAGGEDLEAGVVLDSLQEIIDLGLDPVLRVKKDFPVSVPDPISFEPLPVALLSPELLS